MITVPMALRLAGAVALMLIGGYIAWDNFWHLKKLMWIHKKIRYNIIKCLRASQDARKYTIDEMIGWLIFLGGSAVLAAMAETRVLALIFQWVPFAVFLFILRGIQFIKDYRSDRMLERMHEEEKRCHQQELAERIV